MVDLPADSRGAQESDHFDEFENIGAAVPDLVVTISPPEATVFHRPDSDDATQPTCRTRATEYRAVDPADAMRWGCRPCTQCFASVLDHLARQPDSAVAFADAGELADAAETNTIAADGGHGRTHQSLSSLTARVLYSTNGKTYHAPNGEGEPLCGQSGEFFERDRKKIESHYRPCQACFDIEEK